MIRRVLLFGIEILRIETDETDDEPGDCTTQPTSVGFVRDDLPTWHRVEEA